PWSLLSGWQRSRYGSLRGRSCRADFASRFEECRACRALHWGWRSCALHRPAWREPGGEGGDHQRGATTHVEDSGQSRRPSKGCLRRTSSPACDQSRAVLLRDCIGTYLRRQPARSQATILNWWRQGMMGGAKAHYDGIVAWSQTDFTEDLKKITIPVLVMHGDDDQIVPYADSAPLSAKLLRKGVLKTYKGFPHGMPTTNAETINSDLLAFLKE